MIAHRPPTYAVPFIGRTEELRQIAARLDDPACRLLTLTGPGGIGKTRLALEVARLMMDVASFSDGGCFVPLQPLTSPDLIVPAIADALGFTFRGELDPRQQLFATLRGKHLLLVLDNFEHLAEGADLLPEILENAPDLKILVTSRERLRLREEWLFDVGGLAVPDDAHSVGWADFPAVQLFLHGAHRAGYVPADADTASIVRICRGVSGIPLAVELAAAWVRVMSCADIAREIEHSLDILTTTLRNMPEKHRSMRAAFDHSWALLTGQEQAVFSRLSVFRGGFSREGAEQVAGATLAILASLVDKSLVQVDATGRYDLHELLRQYAADRLREAGEQSDVIQRHGDYFLGVAEGAEAHAFGREQIAWFDRLEVEFDNLRAAFAWSLETETGLRLAAALAWFFSERSHWYEGHSWLEQALTANPAAPPSLRAKATHSLAALAGLLGDLPRARALGEQALALARPANDRWNIAWSLSRLGILGDKQPKQSAALLDESLALFRELDDPMGIAHTLIRRGWYALQLEDYPTVRRYLEEALIRAQAAGDRVIMAWAAYDLGRVSWFQDHDLPQARTYFERSLALFREARTKFTNPLFLLAEVERAVGNLAHAQLLYEENLILLLEIMPNQRQNATGELAGLANIALTRGLIERAARLLGATLTSDLDGIFQTPTASNAAFFSDVAAVRTQLGETAFAEAWAAGQAMTPEQAILYALEGPPPAEPLAPLSPSDLLNPRELEVLRLVASGLSNREIAGQLFVTVNTVKWYLKGIFGKLQVANRIQAVARAEALELL